jgi:hypothetical protein
MKVHVALASFIFTLCAATASAEMSQGVVAVGERGCLKSDKIVIYTKRDFVIAEVHSGFFDKDDFVVGDLNSYGFKNVLVNGRSGKIYVDDYMLSREQAAEKCYK